MHNVNLKQTSEHRKSLHKNDAFILKSSCKQFSSAMRATQIAPFPIFRYEKYKRGVNYVHNTVFLTKMLRWLVLCDIVSVDVNFLCELFFSIMHICIVDWPWNFH